MTTQRGANDDEVTIWERTEAAGLRIEDADGEPCEVGEGFARIDVNCTCERWPHDCPITAATCTS